MEQWGPQARGETVTVRAGPPGLGFTTATKEGRARGQLGTAQCSGALVDHIPALGLSFPRIVQMIKIPSAQPL